MKLILEIPFASESAAKKGLSSLRGEQSFEGRAKVSLSQSKNSITVEINAEDLASLHAAAGSYLRALKVITSVQRFSRE